MWACDEVSTRVARTTTTDVQIHRPSSTTLPVAPPLAQSSSVDVSMIAAGSMYNPPLIEVTTSPTSSNNLYVVEGENYMIVVIAKCCLRIFMRR